MWGQIISTGIQAAGNIYSGYRSAENNRELIAIKKRTQNILAGAALTTLINSYTKRAQEAAEQVRVQEAAVKEEAITGRGAAAVEAAAVGATSERAQLAREAVTTGAADKKLALMSAAAENQQDAMLDKVENAGKQIYLNLLSAPVDVAEDYDPLGDIFKAGADIYGILKEEDVFQAKRKEAIIEGST